MDAASILGIILSVSSITLAIVAIWFSWVTYKNSTEMQMKSQSILEQITQKVEVIVDKTSHQVDRAWDYFTQKEVSNINKKEEVSFDSEKLKKEIVEETKNETIKIIKETGLDIEKVRNLESKVEDILNRTTEKAEDVFNKERMLDRYEQVEKELKQWFLRIKKWDFPPNILLPHIISNKEISSFLPETILFKLREIIDVRNKIAHSKELDKDELRNSIFIANDLISFFSIK